MRLTAKGDHLITLVKNAGFISWFLVITLMIFNRLVSIANDVSGQIDIEIPTLTKLMIPSPAFLGQVVGSL
jgi:hypothetical protein